MEPRENLPKSEHLILLVGSNPLPNAVAGSLLTSENATITMLHSRGSHPIAQNLKLWTERRKTTVSIFLKEVDESDPVSIAERVKEALGEVQSNSVGLHYTGGTKTMGVHAYRAVERWAKAQNSSPKTHFSYLNARTLKMIIDPNDPYSGGSSRQEYVGDVEISLQDLLSLHGRIGWKKQPPSNTPVLPRTARALVDLHVQDPQKWRDWKNEELYKQCKKDGKANNKWKSQYDLNQLTLCLPTTGLPAEVTRAFSNELCLKPLGGLPLKTIAQACDYGANTEHFCGWLDGRWLESALLDVLQNLPHELKLHDVMMNIEPKLSTGTHFEVDVAAIRGYQLFAFSCSTARDTRGDRNMLKKRLFEVVIRARQMGGDEACVALVCCHQDPAILQAETRNLFLDPDDERIKVFGQPHLTDLKKHIEKWIKTQSHA